MMQFTEGQRKALAGLCRIEIKRWKAVSESNPNMRYMVDLMETSLAALTAELTTAPAVPDGWKLVPIEPSWEMLAADGCKEHHKGQPCSHHDNRRRIWSAMLAATPSPSDHL